MNKIAMEALELCKQGIDESNISKAQSTIKRLAFELQRLEDAEECYKYPTANQIKYDASTRKLKEHYWNILDKVYLAYNRLYKPEEIQRQYKENEFDIGETMYYEDFLKKQKELAKADLEIAMKLMQELQPEKQRNY